MPYALAYTGYDFDKELLDHLYGLEKKIGNRSVKILLDVLTHSMKQNAVNELLNRE